MPINFLHRKERVILTAIEIIDELGIQGLSTREIAKRQDISEGTLFRHFKAKNDIILAVLDYFSKYDADIFESVKLKGLKPREAIIFVVDSHVTYYENYPAITAMGQILGALAYEPDFKDKIKEICSNHRQLIKGLAEEGKKCGEIGPGVDCDILADIITGTSEKIVLAWRLNSFNFPLRQKTLFALNMLLDAFK